MATPIISSFTWLRTSQGRGGQEERRRGGEEGRRGGGVDGLDMKEKRGKVGKGVPEKEI